MTKERKRWFVGTTKVPTRSTTSHAALPAEKTVEQKDVDGLANKLSVGATIGGIDPDVERLPPPRGVPVELPQTTIMCVVRWSSDNPPPDFQHLFTSLLERGAVLRGHLQALNFDIEDSKNGGTLLPKREDGTSYVPKTPDAEGKLADGISELNITNDAASRALSKTSKPGEVAPRLVNMRKFWHNLEKMSEYWDTTADKYYTIEVPVESNETGQEPTMKMEERYKGRRTTDAREMPDAYRADTVNAFVEGVTNAFNCRVTQAYVAPGRFAPLLQVGNLEQPVRLTSVVMRLPTDREKARAGIMEGPLMGVLERNTTDFGSSLGSNVSSRKSEHDQLREIGAMLLIAQQRSREGQEMPKKDRWYTTNPRWGGGTGGKTPKLQQCEDHNAEIMARIANTTLVSPELKAQRLEARNNLNKAGLDAKHWATLKAHPGSWHAKTDYKAIGKAPGSPYDEIFLVSCLYHHVSVLKLTIHDAYTRYLTTGIVPDREPAEEDWCSPRLERSNWYDLFDQKNRVYAFRLIWGVMEYLNREVVTNNETRENTANGTQT